MCSPADLACPSGCARAPAAAAAAEEKKLKLKSPNFVVSDCRLSVRNVPTAWTEKQLKQAFIAAVSLRGAKGRSRAASLALS